MLTKTKMLASPPHARQSGIPSRPRICSSLPRPSCLPEPLLILDVVTTAAAWVGSLDQLAGAAAAARREAVGEVRVLDQVAGAAAAACRYDLLDVAAVHGRSQSC